MDRLREQIEFLLEADRVKQVIRRSRITGGTRYENDGEHMWHVALAALVLAEHSDDQIDVGHVIRMLLVHDLVEIDAGDAFPYDRDGAAAKEAAERTAADRIFALLPSDQGGAIRALWEEYESRTTPEARFAAAVDRLLPVLLNSATEGSTWKEYGITAEQVLWLNSSIGSGSLTLWEFVQRLVDDCVRDGYLDQAGGSFEGQN
jgi:putative hydrolase of HD superfamily